MLSFLLFAFVHISMEHDRFKLYIERDDPDNAFDISTTELWNLCISITSFYYISVDPTISPSLSQSFIQTNILPFCYTVFVFIIVFNKFRVFIV